MRRAYGDTIRRLFKARAGPATPWAMAAKLLSAHIRPGLIRPFTAPLLATVEVTSRCNQRCVYCEACEEEGRDQDLDWITEVIRELGRAGVWAMGFTGGEPLLAEGFPAMAREAAQAGMLTHLNTNATVITPDCAHALLESGLQSINVSLDGATEEVHDCLRGTGRFARTLEGIENLVQARKQLARDTRLLLVMTLCDTNGHQALDLLSLARALGVNGCSFLPLLRTSSLKAHPPASESAARAAAALATRTADPMVDNSIGYLAGMVRYFKGAPRPGRCSALHTSILVSPDRKIYPCVPAAMRGQGARSCRPDEIMDLFASGDLAACIDETLCSACWWNCHRELDLALGVI